MFERSAEIVRESVQNSNKIVRSFFFPPQLDFLVHNENNTFST